MNAPAAFSRLWRRLAVCLRGLREVSDTRHLPTAASLGLDQLPESGGSDTPRHSGRDARSWNDQWTVENIVRLREKVERLEAWARTFSRDV